MCSQIPSVALLYVLEAAVNNANRVLCCSDGVHRCQEQTPVHINWWDEDAQSGAIASSCRWHPHAPWKVRLDAFVWLLPKEGDAAFAFFVIVFQIVQKANRQMVKDNWHCYWASVFLIWRHALKIWLKDLACKLTSFFIISL